MLVSPSMCLISCLCRSLHIMEFLKGYCSNSSRRVIITLNRPSLFVWKLIDNVILLSRGHVVFEGSRLTMEPFFASFGVPTPARFSEVEHYLAVVNNFRRPRKAVNWETAFQTWQQTRAKRNSQYIFFRMMPNHAFQLLYQTSLCLISILFLRVKTRISCHCHVSLKRSESTLS